MKLILEKNIFEFNGTHWKQNIGAAMGSRPIPPYANIFMANMDDKIMNLTEANAISVMKRFLDDYFSIHTGTTTELHTLFNKMNQIHPTIKFTMNHTSIQNEPTSEKCDCPEKWSIPFLDVSCSIKDGTIETDLYKKETDRNQYLLPSSCHPKQTTKSIPRSLGVRIVRICSNPEERDKRLEELRDLLVARQYPLGMVEATLEEVKLIPREKLLQKVKPKVNNRPVLAVPYDPRLPSLSNIQSKHWRAMTSQDSYLKQVFKEPPLTAYRRNQNIRGHLIRARVPKNKTRPERIINGMKKCEAQCTACPYIREGKSITINNTNWKIKRKLDCNSYNVVYAICCKKENCKEVYIGETKRMLKFRLADHRGYVVNKVTTQATGEHFNLPGHSLSDLTVTVLEQTKRKSTAYRKEREHYLIRKLDTYYNGINRQM
jgi:hypothetical protein